MCGDYTSGDLERLPPAVYSPDRESKETGLRRWSWTRRLLLLLAFLPLTIRCLLVRGFVAPIRITGASMAGTLHGQHLRIDCDDCLMQYACGLRHRGESGHTTCPNCGYDQNSSREALCQGDRVLIDQWYGMWQQPARWDLVALPSPDGSSAMIVKRLIGMPGEQIAIQHGDVYVNGRLLRKPLGVLREMAILVHDDRYQPRLQPRLPRRWRAERNASGWQGVAGGYRFDDRSSPTSTDPSARPTVEWLTYRHWLCFPKAVPPAPRGEEIGVLDSLGYNQQAPRSRLNAVTDLMFSTRVTIDGMGQLSFRVADGATWYIAELSWPSGDWQLWRDSDRVLTVSPQFSRNVERLDIEYGLYDRMIVLTVNGRLLFEHQLRPDLDPSEHVPTSRLSIGAAGICADVSGLRVFRDVHFLAPGPPWSYWCTSHPLAADQFLLLGDNAAVSTDSRHWVSAGVASNSITGRVIRWPNLFTASR
ncbi:MAG: signal peptidase I [Planctomycetaceae bacterium]|nr:signal peptidase I [Planctomycetaceae bacterium]